VGVVSEVRLVMTASCLLVDRSGCEGFLKLQARVAEWFCGIARV
jgi:hypothetical protein